jgi:hypothetical protein
VLLLFSAVFVRAAALLHSIFPIIGASSPATINHDVHREGLSALHAALQQRLTMVHGVHRERSTASMALDCSIITHVRPPAAVVLRAIRNLPQLCTGVVDLLTKSYSTGVVGLHIHHNHLYSRDTAEQDGRKHMRKMDGEFGGFRRGDQRGTDP